MSAVSIEQILQLAATWHQSGQPALAEPLYRQVLAVRPDHGETLRRLGMLKLQTGQHDDAVRFLARAAALIPHDAQLQRDLATARRFLGRAHEARTGEESAPTSLNASRRLFFVAPPNARSGWGVCMSELLRELRKFKNLEVHLLDPSTGNSQTLDGTVFMPLADHALNPYTPARGMRNLGYTFFEYDLEPPAAANARRLDVLFCGSTWCRDRLRDRGIHNGKVLVQGVDQNIFHPITDASRSKSDEIRLFSGGKFEFRKGQDIVIAAFRNLLRQYPKARLLCAWHNWWPHVIENMRHSPHISLPRGKFDNQMHFYRAMLIHNGIPEDRFEILPILEHPALADVMRSTDLGVFPNRCEGGTNLVLMEYLACGRTVVASGATGHADVLRPEYAMLTQPHLTPQFWDEPDVTEITRGIMQLLEDPARSATLGAAAAEAMRPWTWDRAARTILETIVPGEP